jgi:hypothetical protein
MCLCKTSSTWNGSSYIEEINVALTCLEKPIQCRYRHELYLHQDQCLGWFPMTINTEEHIHWKQCTWFKIHTSKTRIGYRYPLATWQCGNTLKLRI